MRGFLKKYLAKNAALPKNRYLQKLTLKLQNTRIWGLDRRSVAKGVAVGLLICYLPIPFQMLLATLLACICCANLSIALLMTWFTNPFTFVPINLFICQVGAWVIGKNPQTLSVSPTLEWTHESVKAFAHFWFSSLGKAYLVGLPIVSISSAVLGYILVQLIWRVTIYWRRRQRVIH